MFRIVNKKELNSTVTLLEIEAPFVARKYSKMFIEIKQETGRFLSRI